MKASIFITSYPNTKDKIDILEQCISSVKNSGFPVILVSNMKIPGEITSMVKECLSGGNEFNFSDSFGYVGDSLQMRKIILE